jgi:proton-coupled amino acid transporter
MMHIIKGNVGTGILAMASAFKNSGLLVGTIGLPIMGVIAIHCMHLLVRCQETLCAKLGMTFLDYEDVAEKAFETGPIPLRRLSRAMRRMVIVFLYITQLGFCCVYGLFAAESLSSIVKGLFQWNISTEMFLLILLPFMILANMIRTVKSLGYLSAVANFLQLSGLTYVFINLFQDLPPTSSAKTIGDLKGIPLFFGTAIYAFEGIGIVLPIKKDMAEPTAFGGIVGVLNTSMTIVACLYTGMGFFGFLKFGDDVKGNIALNLPPGPANEVIRLMFAIAIFLSYPLQMYVPVSMLWPQVRNRFRLEETSRRGKFCEMAFRACMVTGTFVVAAAVPQLDLFISLVGAFSSSCLALIFPPLLDTMVFWHEQKGASRIKIYRNLAKNIFISVFGIIGFITGTYCALDLIIAFFTKKSLPV